ncbi:hypothetical protein [Helicobacter macacae]|uniref:hypothetical protein n=1 Tax=Helicobacter macacae TaxID=398626 RepID=UPI0012EC42F9|nr:hypothetical protein [Helicobacter macacae]
MPPSLRGSGFSHNEAIYHAVIARLDEVKSWQSKKMRQTCHCEIPRERVESWQFTIKA